MCRACGPTSISARSWSGYDDGDRARHRRSADRAARRAVRLQRHQLLSARRHRSARQRHAARPVRARADLRAARHEGHDVPAARDAAAADRADRELHAARLAVRRVRTRRCSAASSTIPPRGAWAASPATPACSARAADLSIFCRMLLGGGVYHGARILSPLAVAKMTTRRRGRRPERPRPRLGYRLRRSRRTAASCCRSDRSATPASRARRCGSIR